MIYNDAMILEIITISSLFSFLIELSKIVHPEHVITVAFWSIAVHEQPLPAL